MPSRRSPAPRAGTAGPIPACSPSSWTSCATAASPTSPPSPPARPSPPGCTARSRSAAVARRTTCRPCRRTCDGTSTTGRREAGSPTGTWSALVPSGSPLGSPPHSAGCAGERAGGRAAGRWSGSRSGWGAARRDDLARVAAAEALHAAGGVDHAPAPGPQRVGVRGDLDVDHRVLAAVLPGHGVLGGAGGVGEESGAGAAVAEDHGPVGGMDVLLHEGLLD